MRIAVVIPIWGRPALTERVLEYYSTVRVPVATVSVVAVVSDTDTLQPGVPSSCVVLRAPNEPLGRKWNVGIRAAFEAGADAVMICGSDDLISEGWFAYAADRIARGVDYVRPVGCYRWTSDRPSRVAMLPSFTTGAGRLLSRRMIEKLRGRAYDPDANVKLDASLDRRASQVDVRYANGRIRVDPKIGAILNIEDRETKMWAFDGDCLVSTSTGEALSLRGIVYLPIERFRRDHFPRTDLEAITGQEHPRPASTSEGADARPTA